MFRILFVAVAIWLAIVDLGARGEDWITLENCRLVPSEANDGDSFHVRANDKEYIFRLYLVDAPETDAANPARLIEQAKYFGISVLQVIELGEAAKLFVEEKLAEPFTVFTRMSNAMGRSNIERFMRSCRRRKAISANNWSRTASRESTEEGPYRPEPQAPLRNCRN